MAPFWYQLFMWLTFFRRNNQTLFTFGFFTKANSTADFCHQCRIFWFTCFEQVSNTWQTPGNITGLTAFLRNTRQDVTNLNFHSVSNTYNRTTWQEVLSRNIRTHDIDVITMVINQLNHRTHIFRCTTTLFWLTDNQTGQTSDLIHLLINGNTFNQIA